ncbi:MAG: HAD-IIIA family hydrolase [Deltaproteobacteria bacterium]|nr:HAD-IIIA family hydrolase [Deltaproteobacteria bacterium]
MSEKISIKQAVILAGGIGSRLKPLTDNLPKPMIPFHGRPFLEYLVQLLIENGITEIILLLGYLPEKIIDHFGDGSKWGIKISYSVGSVEEETGTRIRNAAGLLAPHFLLMYCDNYWPLNLQKISDFYNERPVLATGVVYTNRDGFTQNNIMVDGEGFVVKYDKTRQDKSLNGVEIGFFILDRKILEEMPPNNFSFEKEIFPKLIGKRELRGFMTDQRYYSVGKLERLPETEAFLKPKKVICLDRDGVINKKAPEGDYVKSWAEFEFLPGAKEAVRLLTEKGYDIYIITNQAGVARGMMSHNDLEEIHKNMQAELQMTGGKIKKIYACTHGWNEGCACRKPKPGMLFQIAKENHVDLSKIFFIGDDDRDMQAGKAAGSKTILITPQKNLLAVVQNLV